MNVSEIGMKKTAALLKESRMKMGLTGNQAAAWVNLSPSQYSRLEAGLVKNWSAMVIVGAAKIIGMTQEEIVELLNDAPQPRWITYQEQLIAEETEKIIEAAAGAAAQQMERTDMLRDYLETHAETEAEFQSQMLALIEGKIEMFQQAAAYITADLESDLANLKRMMVRIEAAVDTWYQIHKSELESLTD